jgi:hypothetical protein
MKQSDEAMKQSDEALNAPSLQFLRNASSPFLLKENHRLTLHRRYFFKEIHRLTLHRRYFLK